ncbi:MAG: hypothetical protein DWH91_06415 [Planctomycetota bacterium]|nr:MAG: hypothetical protein DWH91_06415 [Planctomycetota bacterium]
MTALPPVTPDALQEEFFLTDAARLRRWLPWLHLPAILRLAFDPRKLILSLMALVLLGIPSLIRQKFDAQSHTVPLPWSPEGLFHPSSRSLPGTEQIFANPAVILQESILQGPAVLTPVHNVYGQGQQILGPRFRWGRTSLRMLELLWTWAVWAVLGTLLCRLAALDFLGRDTGWGEAWRYCRSRFLSAFSAPLLPLIGIIGLWLPCVVAGGLTRIAGLGEPLVAAAWPIVWMCGGGLTLMLFGLTICWPLMIATVSIEGTDAFDGLSRSYNYLFSRPWYLLWMVCFAIGLCGGGMFAVRWLAASAETLALQSFDAGASDAVVERFAGVSQTSAGGPPLVKLWRQVFRLGTNALAHSLFWSSVTVIFLLLRKSVDSTPLDQLGAERRLTGNELPLVGIPAAERRQSTSRPTP